MSVTNRGMVAFQCTGLSVQGTFHTPPKLVTNKQPLQLQLPLNQAVFIAYSYLLVCWRVQIRTM